MSSVQVMLWCMLLLMKAKPMVGIYQVLPMHTRFDTKPVARLQARRLV